MNISLDTGWWLDYAVLSVAYEQNELDCSQIAMNIVKVNLSK